MSVIASASKDIKFFQWPEGALQQNYLPRSHDGFIQSISWGKDGSWVVVVPDSGPTEIISIKDNVKLLQTIQDIHRPSCASFHTTTKKLIGIGTVGGQVMIYDIKAKTIKKRFPRASSKICSLHYNSKDTHIAATCNNGEILILSNIASNISTIYKVPNSNSVTSASFHRLKRNLFAAGSDIGIVATWDINSNHMLCNLQAHQAEISSIAFSPLRVDLLVTGGLDRKFSFYDLSIKKSVLDIEVNNSITSLDFSHCGVYLGIGFQNGYVAIYDTRRTLNSPLSMFEAHSGSRTRHLQFQKCFSNSTSNNSVFDITIEETPCTQQDVGNRLSSNVSVFDSIGIVGCDDSNVQGDVHLSKRSQECDDSFMIAMGLDGTNQSESVKNDSSHVYGPIDGYKRLSGNFYCRNSGRTNSSNIKTSSTPKYPDQELPNTVESPILPLNQTIPLCHAPNSNTPGNFQTMIKDIVRQEARDIVQQEVKDIVQREVRDIVQQEVNIVRHELKSQIEALRSSIKYDFTDMMSQVRCHILDLQMTIVKEFVNMEMQMDNR